MKFTKSLAFRIVTTMFVLLLGIIVPGLLIQIGSSVFGLSIEEVSGTDAKVSPALILILIILTGLVTIIVSTAYKFLTKRKISNLGFKKWNSKEIIFSYLLGAVIVLITSIVPLIIQPNSNITWAVPNNTSLSIVIGFYLLFFVFFNTLNSFNEELLYRVYPLESLIGESKAVNIVIITVASMLFSLMHHFTEPFTWQLFIYRILFGITASCIYLITRSIWIVIGFHSGANWMELTFSGNYQLGGLLSLSVNGENIVGNYAHQSYGTIPLLGWGIITGLFIYIYLKKVY